LLAEDATARRAQDPAKRHELDRAAVRELECALCGLRQPVGASCAACGVGFGAYACLRCCFFDDDLRKQQFHCDACGICRVGGRANFFHCATCGCCYAATLEARPPSAPPPPPPPPPPPFPWRQPLARPPALLPARRAGARACLMPHAACALACRTSTLRWTRAARRRHALVTSAHSTGLTHCRLRSGRAASARPLCGHVRPRRRALCARCCVRVAWGGSRTGRRERLPGVEGGRPVALARCAVASPRGRLARVE